MAKYKTLHQWPDAWPSWAARFYHSNGLDQRRSCRLLRREPQTATYTYVDLDSMEYDMYECVHVITLDSARHAYRHAFMYMRVQR